MSLIDTQIQVVSHMINEAFAGFLFSALHSRDHLPDFMKLDKESFECQLPMQIFVNVLVS